MGVMAYPLRYALADLALALSRACRGHRRGAGHRRPRGRRHDRRRRRRAAAARRRPVRRDHLPPPRPGAGRPRSAGSSTGPASCPTTTSPPRSPPAAVRSCSPPTAARRRWPAARTDAGTSHAAVLCPIIVDNTYAGYLILTRAQPGAFYAARRGRAGPGHRRRAVAWRCPPRSARERLRASEETYRRVLETIPEGVLQLDTGRRGDVRERAHRRGPRPAPRSSWSGVSLRGFLDDQGQNELTRRLAECKAGRSTVGATRLLRADGSQRSVRISMMPLHRRARPVRAAWCAWSPTPPTTSTPAGSSASSTTCAGWTAWAS